MLPILLSHQKLALAAYLKAQSPNNYAYFSQRANIFVKYLKLTFQLNAFPKICIFAGANEKGIQALHIAKLLQNNSCKTIHIYLSLSFGNLTTDAEEIIQELKAIKQAQIFPLTHCTTRDLAGDSLVIDGILGYGVHMPIAGEIVAIIQDINHSKARVVSIDTPSGLFAEQNKHNRHIIKADYTFAFDAPTLSLILSDHQKFVHQLTTLSNQEEPLKGFNLATNIHFIQDNDVAAMIKHRDSFAHKGTFGHALVIAGKEGMSGAAHLSATASLKSGIGKLSIRCPRANRIIHQICLPEAILEMDEHNSFFSVPISTDYYDAMAIGPGIGLADETVTAFIKQVKCTKCPIVIDADGINILANHQDWISHLPRHTILTPHPGEFRRMTSATYTAYELLESARKIASQHHLYIVLKGHYTAICTPNDKVYINTTGNSGMATAGSGDVLSGIITGLLAQHYHPKEACLLGVYLHGLAGDFAAEKYGEESMLASNILEFIPQAFKTLKRKK